MSTDHNRRIPLEILLREGRIDEAVARVEALVAKLDQPPTVSAREAVERVVARFAPLRKFGER